ncbi:MAG: hypothetical protein ACH349_04300 [Candidatus Rhabdochlamydia sp.]|jgi:hypothetical protein|nr:hypothetical protein [Chlamydiota bacterium]
MAQIKAIDYADREFKLTRFLRRSDQLMHNANHVALPAIALFVASTL